MPALKLSNVSVTRSGTAILDDVSWSVDDADRWVVLGPNGAGKSTMLELASAGQHPSKGTVSILGETLGKVDVFELRPRIGIAASSLIRRIPAWESVRDVVITAAWSVQGRWHEEYDAPDEARADDVLAQWQLTGLAHRTFGTLSDGERKRTLIARAVMTDPELLLLDEPAGSLDLGAREDLIELLTEYAASRYAPAIVMVTHRVEEIPPGFTHALLLAHGKVVAQGPIEETLTSERLTETFSRPLTLHHEDGRYTARA